MFQRMSKILFVLFLITLLTAACGGQAVPVTQPAVGNVPTSAPQPTVAAQTVVPTQFVITPSLTSAPSLQEPYTPVIDPANFVTVVDNPYMPLKPGTTYIYEGKTEKGNEHNEVFVSPETKVIMGVTCIVVKDKVMVDGVLEEQTLDWYAQDKQGNVWYFGEDSKDYDKTGAVTSTQGSWLAGVDGALPGIVMQANPVAGQTYRQEYKKGEAEDLASVLSLSESLTIPLGSYSNMLMTNEWSALDNPPIYEHKYYAKGIGFIMTKYMTGGFELKLIEIRNP